MRKKYLIGPTTAAVGLAAFPPVQQPSSQRTPSFLSHALSRTAQVRFRFRSCDQRIIERLEKECLLDDGGTVSWAPNVD